MDRATGKIEGKGERLLHLWPFLALAALILFHIVNNWMWLSTNVTSVGWDPMDHLVTTLVYNDILRRVDLRSLFSALTWSDYYPPLVHLSALVLYKIFGISMDTAVKVNFVYLAILLLSTYGIGRNLFGKGTGLLAAFILSTFPMIYAMSRYFYIDFALTAMVALSICLLLYTAGFQRRGYALLYGLSLGLGMLVKWTFVAFALPPLLLVLARSSLLRKLWEGVRGWRLEKRWLGLAAGLGLILTLIWYLPNSERVKQLILGVWLFPISWLVFTLTIYALSRPRSQRTNFWSSILLGLTVAGAWYIPKINFFQGFLLNSYGKPTGRGWGFAPYLSYLINEEVGPFYTFFLLVAAFSLLVWGRKALKEVRVGEGMALLATWLLVPYFIFSFRVSTVHSRYIMAILPAVALFIAWGLMEVPHSGAKPTLIVLVTLIALGQFFVLSYDGLDGPRRVAVVDLPSLGKVNLLAHGYEIILLPATGPTDPRYWIVPDILDDIMADKGDEREEVELGLFVNFHQLHEKHFLYLIYTDYPEIRLRELARNWSGRPAYPQIYEVDYLALRNQSDHRVAAESQEVIAMMLSHPPDILSQAFQPLREYPMPDGSIIYLYKRRYPRPDNFALQDLEALGREIAALVRSEDALLLDPPGEINLVGPYYRGEAKVYLFPEEGLNDEAMTEALEEIISQHLRLFFVSGGEGGEKARFLEEWLSRKGYRAWDGWYGAARLVIYTTSLGKEKQAEEGLRARFGEGIDLLGYALVDQKVNSGEIIRLTLHWKTREEMETGYKVFVHLLDGEGKVVAQRDSEPVGGSRPTSGWRIEEKITDNYGIILPKELPSGEYQLVVGMYDPTSGERLPIYARDGERLPGDQLPLGAVEVTP
jgi:4-amino-4-deoxy-L-arabinose transferase-like glycosyltransferase